MALILLFLLLNSFRSEYFTDPLTRSLTVWNTRVSMPKCMHNLSDYFLYFIYIQLNNNMAPNRTSTFASETPLTHTKKKTESD